MTTGKSKGNSKPSVVHSYDPAHYIIPAQDHNGHSTRVFCRLQPTVDHELDSIVQSNKWPFKTKSDLLRWCIWEGIKQLERMRPVPGSMFVVADAIIKTCRAKEQWISFQSTVKVTEQVVNAMMESGNEQEAFKLMSELRALVLKLEEASWRDQWMGEFDKRFGHHWERVKKVPVDLSVASKG